MRNGRCDRSIAVDVALRRTSAPKRSAWRAHLLHQIGAQDAVAEARIVVDGRGQHQLTALLDALDDQRLEIGAAGVQRRRQTRRTSPDDGDLRCDMMTRVTELRRD